VKVAVSWETTNQPPYSPDLTTSDFHLFGPLKLYPGGQKFQSDDELKCSVWNWLCSQDKTLYSAGVSSLPGQWKK
jgi:hypothetical protein